MAKDVNVIITRETAALTQAGFGMPLILATNADVAYGEYEDIASVANSFAETTEAYKMAAAIFAQNPRPQKIAMYGKAYTALEPVAATLTTALVGTNDDLKFTSKLEGAAGNNIEIEYLDPGEATVSTVAEVTGTGTALDPYIISVTLEYDGAITATAAELKEAIEADTTANSLVTVTYPTSNDGTGVVTALTSTALTGGTDGSDTTILTSALNDLIETKNDWYFLLCEEQGGREIKALSGWVDTQKKLYFATTDNLDLAATLESERTAIWYTDDPANYLAERVVGRCAPEDPGSITWKFKTVNGGLPVYIATADLTQLHADHGNTYITQLGINQTSEGYVTSGEYIDVIRSQDFIEARMIESVSRVLFLAPKVPFTNAGIAQIGGAVNGVLQLATRQGIIADNGAGQGVYTLTLPDISQISDNDKALRKLTGVRWTAVLAGAIHSIEIRGTLTLSI